MKIVASLPIPYLSFRAPATEAAYTHESGRFRFSLNVMHCKVSKECVTYLGSGTHLFRLCHMSKTPGVEEPDEKFRSEAQQPWQVPAVQAAQGSGQYAKH